MRGKKSFRNSHNPRDHSFRSDVVAMRGHYSVVWDAVAQAIPDRPAIITRNEMMTYGQFQKNAASLAHFLISSGLKPGDPVAIFSYNRPEYLVCLFACFATGLTPVPINYRYRAQEVADLLIDSHVLALIYPRSLSRVIREAIELTPHEVHTIEINDEEGQTLPGSAQYSEVIEHPGSLPKQPPPGGQLRLYTGGTTGKPKAVVWGTEDILDVQMYSIYTASGLDYPENMDDVVRIASDPQTPRVATLPLAPFMHGTALFTSINTLVIGGSVIIHSSARFDAHEAVSLAIDEEVTRVIVAGDAIALPLIEAVEEAGLTTFGKVSSIISSGMRFSDSTKKRIHLRGNIKIIDLLAATEGGPFAVSVTESVEDLPGTLALLPGGVVLDENLNEIQDVVGAQGILAFRGTLPQGYFGDEAKTKKTFPLVNGVRHVMPGDWVSVKEGGVVELLGRGSAVVNTGGEKVYPLEVEEALLSHPDIIDAVVFGLPHERFGEMVTAVVVPTDGSQITEAELTDFIDASLAGYKKPRHIFFLESLDRSPHGKLDMNKLKEFAQSQIENVLSS